MDDFPNMTRTPAQQAYSPPITARGHRIRGIPENKKWSKGLDHDLHEVRKNSDTLMSIVISPR